MSSFASCSFQRKSNNGTSKGSNSKKSHSQKKKQSHEREADSKGHAQKARASNVSHHAEKEASVDKRSLAFEKEFAKNKAKEFKDTNSKSKAESNNFQRADKAKKIRRNHIDNQRNLKNQEYCLIEEKKYIKKRFLKDDTSEACEDMDKDFAADYETAKEERCRSESHHRCADEKESSFCENAKSMKSECAQKNSCVADEREYSECSDKAYENKCERSDSECSERKYAECKSKHQSKSKNRDRC